MSERERGLRKEFTGIVVSNRMEKSIVVKVERRVRHPLYNKYITKTTKFMAHDEKQECGQGDLVKIAETRPLSRRKRWRLIEILKKAQ